MSDRPRAWQYMGAERWHHKKGSPPVALFFPLLYPGQPYIAAEPLTPDDIPFAPPVEVTAAEPRAIDMVHDLHRAIHGDSWAKAQSPREVWDELLAHVEGLAAGRCHVCMTKGAAARGEDA